ncbi:Npt1/Npt2 family nucleotide transporter [Paenibacillus sp. N3.4]|uniref:Npt1/Npt2 family nucleotide transporter n=1 Tax=Paenibacillus sp. N3.4 TaxID=2603222 RepID=UPI0011C8389E|nr:Npt1/Npt2 family nucleotide transporter [Paenibacillus sp. N3.4]TXK81460.1 cyclic nucleotide-binding domain-containing protein [Paenibacillus sp. N3.4]
MSNVISRKFPLHKWVEDKEEYVKILLLFGYLFCVVSASTIGRTAADTLFLSRFDNSYLSLMYLPQAIVMILAGLLFQRYSPKVRLESLIKWLIPLISVLVLASRFGVGLELRWVFPVIYIGYDVFNFLMIVCFWQFATSVMDQRKAKKMIGIVGSGGITGGILSGFGLKALVPLIGTANLIYAYAGLQLLAMAAVYLILLRTKESVEAKRVQPKSTSTKNAVQRKTGLFANVPHLKYVAILAAALVLSLTLIDYQFKVILRGTLQNEALAGFMGSFYGFSGLIALFVQLFISGRILTRFGVMTALLVFPITLIAGSFGILLLPVLAMAVVVKGSDKVVGDTLYSSVSQLVMFPVSPEWRGKAKSFLDGVVRNGAKGLAAVTLLIVSRLLAPEQLSYIVLVLLGVGIFAGVKVKKAYLHTLLSNLKTEGDDFQQTELHLMDPASRQILVDALSSSDKQQALYAFGILREIDTFDFTPHLDALLHHPNPEVAVAALSYVEQKVPDGFEIALQELIASASEQVRAKALVALAAYAKEEYLEEITVHLEASSVGIQAAAVAGLVKYYSIEGMFRAVGKLKEWMESGYEEERIAMAALFGQIGVKNFYKPLLSLLRDSSPQVRIRALESAAILHVPPLIVPIVKLLKDSQTRSYAIQALAAFDEQDLLPQLGPGLTDKEIQLYLPAVFERIGTQKAFDMLFAYYEEASYDMRGRILEAMLRMQKQLPPVESKKVESLILHEIQLHAQFGEHSACIAGVEGYSDIEEMITDIRAAICQRVFQLLSLLYDEKTMQAVYKDWSEGDSRQQANAEEVIDQTLQGSLRTALTPFMSGSQKMNRVSTTEEQLTEHMKWLSAQGDEWLRETITYQRQRIAGTMPNAELSAQIERVQLLRNVSLFQGLTRKDLSIIALKLHQVNRDKGSIIIQEGDQGDSLMIIDEGQAGIYRNDQLLVELKRGDCFGEMAILTQGLRTATIRAETDIRLWQLDSSDFYEMMFDQTSIAIEMMKLLSRRLRSELARSNETVNANALPDQAFSVVHNGLSAFKSEVDLTKEDVILRRILVLQKIDLFAHLAPNDFLWLAHKVEEVAFDQDEAIFRTGDYGDTMYGIIEGSIRVHRGVEEYAVLQEGEFFGEIAIIDSGPRSADCTARKRTVLLELHRDQVFSFCFQNMNVLKSMMRVIAERLKNML